MILALKFSHDYLAIQPFSFRETCVLKYKTGDSTHNKKAEEAQARR